MLIALPNADATFSKMTIPEPPEVPLKMWLVSMGTLIIA